MGYVVMYHVDLGGFAHESLCCRGFICVFWFVCCESRLNVWVVFAGYVCVLRHGDAGLFVCCGFARILFGWVSTFPVRALILELS